ncbi:DUF1674 domain-containing protein [Limibaculum sp. M0105]|uniref:DUF1674 domain-containing protein n=1 Tax=Thermohalobaculum xanthum TaxID=2753746 RepID=A0A8J7M6A6_9RHOB|nr:DUF1674 domain-containing protein [Thermohalobaculum xanthum]MBK0399134.1 DUF1674 domain-containing protein [Thermohalobaculum xanthum]
MDDAKDREARIQAAAERALAEAEARRKAAAGRSLPKELGGRNGPEPTRFGDWEKDGIISDF